MPTPARAAAPQRCVRRTLATVADDLETAWTAVTVAHWYGAGERAVEVVTGSPVWYHTGLPLVSLRWVLIRDPRGTRATQALLCTDQAVTLEQSLVWVVQRWQLEVTLEETRCYLGVESRHQWSDRAIRRTTPALLSLFSLVTLLAHMRMANLAGATRQVAWYRKERPTFANALALVRRDQWRHQPFLTSTCADEIIKVPRTLLERLTELLCHVA